MKVQCGNLLIRPLGPIGRCVCGLITKLAFGNNVLVKFHHQSFVHFSLDMSEFVQLGSMLQFDSHVIIGFILEVDQLRHMLGWLRREMSHLQSVDSTLSFFGLHSDVQVNVSSLFMRLCSYWHDDITSGNESAR